jgi:hypothetical protein
VAVGAGLLVWGTVASAQECKAPRVAVPTSVGMKYCSDPAFNDAITKMIEKVRADIQAQRQAGKLIA